MHLPDLTTFALSVARDPAQWAQHVRFDPGRRHWARLASPADVDLWLLTWLPDQATELHDHGDAAAAVVVLSGRLTEVRATHDGRLSQHALEPGDVHGLPVGTVHDVLNAGPEPAVSVHAYSPRLTRMTFWEPAAGHLRPLRTTTVEDDALV